MLNTPTDTDDNDFVLKHRVAGAAFLLFFGALVLPWLLGPPSEASKPVESVDVDTQISEEYIPKDLEDEILAQLKEEVVDDETVYISRVTPSGFAKISEEKLANKKKEQARVEKEKAEAKKAEAKKAEARKAEARKAEARKAEARKAEAKKAEAKKAEAKKAEAKKAEALAKENDKETSTQLNEQERARIAAEQLAKALDAESKNATIIKKGWVVQVGVFTDKSGAKKVSDSLDKNGFKPSSTVVDTNLGIGTGTRVWLGPFSSKEEAGKVKEKLAEKTGSSGFVRAYP